MKKLTFFMLLVLGNVYLYSSSGYISSDSDSDSEFLNYSGSDNESDDASAIANDYQFVTDSLVNELGDKVVDTSDTKINLTEKNNITILMSAINHEDVDKIEKILKSGANPNQANKQGVTPLFLATYCKNKKFIIPMLFKYGATINLIDPLNQLESDDFDYVMQQIKNYHFDKSLQSVSYDFSFNRSDR